MSDKNHSWPSTSGNVWMLEHNDDVFRYISDQYHGQVMGYEERDRVTLAQTPPVAIGMVSFGSDVNVERVLAQRFDWHIVNEKLSSETSIQGAESQAIISQFYTRKHHKAMKTIIAISQSQPSPVAEDTVVNGRHYKDILDRIEEAGKALKMWNKSLFVDRISLSLLSGATDISEEFVDTHYADVAHNLREDVTRLSKQTAFPIVVVSQSAGLQTDGSSEVILAEGKLDIQHPSVGIVVATPAYPFPMVKDMPGTHTAQSAALIDEMESIAISAIHSGQRWYCPSMQSATLDGKIITVDFAVLEELVLDDGFHGFTLVGAENKVKIKSVKAHEKTVSIALDKEPKGELSLNYAWGVKEKKGDGFSANKGALRDTWSAKSAIFADQMLYRFALSGRVKVNTPSTY